MPLRIPTETKLAFERALFGMSAPTAFAMRYLRYFNAAGAAARKRRHALIPKRTSSRSCCKWLRGYGAARPCVRGHLSHPGRRITCVRDYVHVSDLARRICSIGGLTQSRAGPTTWGAAADTPSGRIIREGAAEVTRKAHSQLRPAPGRAGDHYRARGRSPDPDTARARMARRRNKTSQPALADAWSAGYAPTRTATRPIGGAPPGSSWRTTTAGTPATSVSRRATIPGSPHHAPAAITTPRPTETPGRIVTRRHDPDAVTYGDRCCLERTAALLGGTDLVAYREQKDMVSKVTRDRRSGLVPHVPEAGT